MSSYVLFVFEGRVTEQNITENLCKFFLNEKTKTVIRASYGFNIYQLYQSLENDPYQDIYQLVVDELNKRQIITVYDQQVIDVEDPNEISDIYLFFDYDCHCSNADNEKLGKMLDHFSDSQETGLLCVSYPMVEAIRHQSSAEPSQQLHPIEDLAGYKRWVNKTTDIDRRYFNWGLYDAAIWNEIICVNLARANLLVNNVLDNPKTPLEQKVIFQFQLSEHIPNQVIAVISAFPLMLHNYYGDSLVVPSFLTRAKS